MQQLIGKIIAFETGELSNAETIKLFSELIKSGTINHLQGFYGRIARNLIKAKLLKANGAITQLAKDKFFTGFHHIKP